MQGTATLLVSLQVEDSPKVFAMMVTPSLACVTGFLRTKSSHRAETLCFSISLVLFCQVTVIPGYCNRLYINWIPTFTWSFRKT